MTTLTEKWMQHAIQPLFESSDPNDLAFRCLLSHALNAWRNGEAAELSRKVHLVLGMDKVFTGRQLQESVN